MKCFSGLSARELPLDSGLVFIDAAAPCLSLFWQGGDISDPSFAEALAAEHSDSRLGSILALLFFIAEHADLHLRLIQPASMFGRGVDRKSVP